MSAPLSEPTPAEPAPVPSEHAVPELAVGGCQACGSQPALRTTLRAHQGLVLIMRTTKSRATLCRDCGTALHRDMTARTLYQGWWGPASFFYTFVVLVLNLVQRIRLGRLAPPAGGVRPPANPGRPLLRRIEALGVLLPFALVGVLAFAFKDAASTAEVGSCVRNKGSEMFPKVVVVDCSSAEAEFRVEKRYDSGYEHCDPSRYAEYSETGRSGFTLCLVPLGEEAP
ncbi:hypothetical protein [Streptomyces sp. NPDC053541]|uniref:LppU/SCO3897 family protein n=1 Tax=Streptomyces sp. NPDC053541 TaxID=3365709 RepID=UPI0037D3302E